MVIFVVDSKVIFKLVIWSLVVDGGCFEIFEGLIMINEEFERMKGKIVISWKI